MDGTCKLSLKLLRKITNHNNICFWAWTLKPTLFASTIMPIIQVPFPLLEVSCHETCFPKYQRAGFLTLSEICRTIRLDVDFIPHEDDVYDELCLGVVIASAETYGHLENLDVTVSAQHIRR